MIKSIQDFKPYIGKWVCKPNRLPFGNMEDKKPAIFAIAVVPSGGKIRIKAAGKKKQFLSFHSSHPFLQPP